jgi:hypothetical protein
MPNKASPEGWRHHNPVWTEFSWVPQQYMLIASLIRNGRNEIFYAFKL